MSRIVAVLTTGMLALITISGIYSILSSVPIQ